LKPDGASEDCELRKLKNSNYLEAPLGEDSEAVAARDEYAKQKFQQWTGGFHAVINAPPIREPQEVPAQEQQELYARIQADRATQITYGRAPPEEYDHPYEGKLLISRENDQETMRRVCPSFNGRSVVACAMNWGGECVIKLARESDMPVALDVVLWHEIGHCNGWPTDHRGMR
jgi:hypothetical protein